MQLHCVQALTVVDSYEAASITATILLVVMPAFGSYLFLAAECCLVDSGHATALSCFGDVYKIVF